MKIEGRVDWRDRWVLFASLTGKKNHLLRNFGFWIDCLIRLIWSANPICREAKRSSVRKGEERVSGEEIRDADNTRQRYQLWERSRDLSKRVDKTSRIPQWVSPYFRQFPFLRRDSWQEYTCRMYTCVAQRRASHYNSALIWEEIAGTISDAPIFFSQLWEWRRKPHVVKLHEFY